ncbi:MAG: purine-nucleoside phosphorylase [Bacillota bacterium]|nr:purine-nucleoside phosphorylase [Bacillota bacterium]
MLKKIQEAKEFIQSKLQGSKPEIGMILGSGLGVLAERLENPIYIEYSDIPHFPVSTVAGHASRFAVGMFEGKCVIVMQGRFHYYEGYTMQEVTFPVRVMALLGIRHLVITNAAGGLHPDWIGGTLMLIRDQINIMGVSPLIGPNEPSFGPRFPDVSEIYNRAVNEKVKAAAAKKQIDLKEGVYFYFTGPAYETPAEVRLAKTLGGDAVGMSTAPEALIAAHMGIPVTGVSCITNLAAGIQESPLLHTEVVEVAARVQEKFIELVRSIVELL